MNLRANILATLAYYDVLDMSLRVEEVLVRLVNLGHLTSLQFTVYSLQQNISLNEIKKELDRLVLDRAVGRAGEYYFLFDREYLAPLRLKYVKIAKHKWRKAKRAIWWLRLVPYVRAVFASGSLAISNTDELSDLDVLIVVKHGRIWLARLMITIALSILGVRRRASDKIAPDKICLNHYITDKLLRIPFKSIYTAQTYSNLVLIYSRQLDILNKFQKANDWVSSFVFSWNIPAGSLIRTGFLELAVKPTEWLLNTRFGNALENWARRFQSKKIARNPATKQTGGRVIFTDQQLEFHPRSIETSIIKKYNENLTKLGLANIAIERDSGLKQ